MKAGWFADESESLDFGAAEGEEVCPVLVDGEEDSFASDGGEEVSSVVIVVTLGAVLTTSFGPGELDGSGI